MSGQEDAVGGRLRNIDRVGELGSRDGIALPVPVE
jgi:hypothetical protein